MLKKETYDSKFDGFDERQTFNILHNYYIEKYHLSFKKKDNKTIILSWIDSGDLIMDKKHRLSLPENSGYVKGVFRIIKNKFKRGEKL